MQHWVLAPKNSGCNHEARDNTGMEAGREMQGGGEKVLTGTWCTPGNLLHLLKGKSTERSCQSQLHTAPGTVRRLQLALTMAAEQVSHCKDAVN